MGLEGAHVGLHLGSDSTGVGSHLRSVAGDAAVGLLDLLGSLGLEGDESTVLGSHGITDDSSGTSLLLVNLGRQLGAGRGALLGIAGKESVEGSEATVGPLHGSLKVLLGLGSSRLD